MLPPDPPITIILPDFDSRITGAIEDGGRSPASGNPIQMYKHHLHSVQSTGYPCDFTCLQCVRSVAKISKLVVQDDAGLWRVNSSSKSAEGHNKLRNGHGWDLHISGEFRSHLVYGAGGGDGHSILIQDGEVSRAQVVGRRFNVAVVRVIMSAV